MIEPGKSADSRLIQLVSGPNDERMPPAEKGDRLAAKEIAILKAWIDAGANILCCVCVIDREQGGREALAEVGIEMRALCTMTELKAAGGK